MKNNVFIRARRRGKLCYNWEGHNVWLDYGREHLANLLSLASFGPDVPVTSERLKYMQFGIGGVQQGAIPGAVDTAYPAGFGPIVTTGNEYDHSYPESPKITTLERPVRFSGGTNPYDTAPGTDVWLSDPAMPKFFVQYPTDFSVALKIFIRGMDGDIAYGAIPEVPLAEAGLFLSDADINEAYDNLAVAYIDFEPLTITDEIEAEVTWIVSF